jgi:hypothetical protein
MSPKKINNSGGSVGRAASGTASRRDAARAADLRVLANGLTVMALTLCVLVFNAPEFWPHLFAP